MRQAHMAIPTLFVSTLALLSACGPETGDLPSAPGAASARQSTEEAPRYSDWSEPVNLGPLVNSPANEIEVSVSRDGLSLYLSSDRAGGSGNYDIWVSRRASVDAPWGPARPIGGAVNTEYRDQAPFLSIDGHRLFFYSDRPDGSEGGLDLWVSRRRDAGDDSGWEAPINLGEGVNSAANETMPVFFEDEASGKSLLYFTSNRDRNNDIYVSRGGDDEPWGPAVPVPELSSPRRDRAGTIRRDGLEMFIGSDRPGPRPEPFDLWVATRASTSEAWSTPVKLDPLLSSAADEPGASLSFDGTTLYFLSDRDGGSGKLDVWMSTRQRVHGQP